MILEVRLNSKQNLSKDTERLKRNVLYIYIERERDRVRMPIYLKI
jgi:hypothetical protein